MMPLSLAFAEHDLVEWAKKYNYKTPEEEAEEESLIVLGMAAGLRGRLTYDEFLQIATWKSSRPTPFYASNSAEAVGEITARSFAASHDLERALTLTALRGVRVRTATAILHLCFPQQYPLLDVWAMTSLGVGRDLTEKWDELDWLRTWPSYVQTCRQIAGNTGRDLRTVDRALFAYGQSVGSRRRREKTDR